MTTGENYKEIQIYQGETGEVVFDFDKDAETIWANQEQIAGVFGVDRTVVGRHIRNILKDGELGEESICAKNARVVNGRVYKQNFYNLDMIISVGYRVNSKKATRFRRWATKIIHDYTVNGVAVNERRIEELDVQKLKEIEATLAVVKRIMGQKELDSGEANGLLEVISKYAPSFRALKEFDDGFISLKRDEKKSCREVTIQDARKMIMALKRSEKGSELFGKERGESFEASLGAIYQSFETKDVYPTVAEKAANLLYLVIKDHPFYDGNKRIGALLFIMFLTVNDYHLAENGETKISDRALTALALLIAESQPEEKALIIALVRKMLE